MKMPISAAHKKAVRRKLRFQLLYLIVVIVPYIFILDATYDIWNTNVSLSRIGWRSHVGGPDGGWFLLAFIVLTCPFMVYQVWFYLKNSGRRQSRQGKFLFILSIVASATVATGAAMPYNRPQKDAPFLHLLHNGFAVLGALLAVLTVTIILVQICREADREIILLFYGIFAALVYYVYTVLVNAAAFQVGMTFVIFVVMYFVNRAVLVGNIRKNLYKLQNEGVER